jgi:hypothetical protein
MEAVLVLLVAASAIWLMTWNVTKLSRFEAAYRHDDGFPGTRHSAVWHLPSVEAEYRGFAGADRSALYLLKDPRSQHHASFRYSLRIPWSDIEYRETRLLFRKCLLFEIPARKTCFFMAADLGRKLLADAGRES